MSNNKEKGNREILCPYCGEKAEWVSNEEIYGRKYGRSYMMYLCRPCDAYVGCHNNTRSPLGTLANKELREWRKKSKNLFIQSFMQGNWHNKSGKQIGYEWLRTEFKREFHFGESTIDDCKLIFEKLNHA